MLDPSSGDHVSQILPAWPQKRYGPSPQPHVYPWHEWLDGRVWALERGVDFGLHPRFMIATIERAAAVRKLNVRTRYTANGVLILQVVE